MEFSVRCAYFRPLEILKQTVSEMIYKQPLPVK